VEFNLRNLWKFVVPSVISTLFGTGAMWQYQESKVNILAYELQAAESSIKFRKELDNIMQKIVATTSKYAALNLCESPEGPLAAKAHEIDAELNLYKNNFIEIEKKLAKIEDRDARDVNLQFSSPCPPTNLSIQYSE